MAIHSFKARLLALSIGVLFAGALLQIAPPHPSAVAANAIEVKLLQRQARHFLAIVRERKQLSNDLMINAYVIQIAKKLAVAGDLEYDSLHYFVIDDSGVNAFAGPGATFFLNSGIIQLAGNEAEVASVMAHELAHFKQDHLNRLIQAHQANQGPSLLAILAGILVGGDAGLATIVGSQAASIESHIEHTLSYEREADSVGLRMLAKAGYDPRNAASFMAKLENHLRQTGIVQSNIHNTHPVTPERVASMNARLNQFSGRTFLPLSTDFFFLKARTQALFDWEPDQTSLSFVSNLSTGSPLQQVASRYGYALSMVRDGHVAKAFQELETLRSLHPDNLWVLHALAEIALEQQRPETAVSLLTALAATEQPHPAVVQLYTLALVDSGQPETAHRYIRKHLNTNSEFDELLRANAQTAKAIGADVDAYILDSDYHFNQGNIKLAKSQLEFAESKADDFYSLAIIREKIRTINQEIEWRQSSN